MIPIQSLAELKNHCKVNNCNDCFLISFCENHDVARVFPEFVFKKITEKNSKETEENAFKSLEKPFNKIPINSVKDWTKHCSENNCENCLANIPELYAICQSTDTEKMIEKIAEHNRKTLKFKLEKILT